MSRPSFHDLASQHPLREQLLRYGIRLKGKRFCCPFHDEKRASANLFRADDGIEKGKCQVEGKCGKVFDSVELVAHMETGGDRQKAADILSGYTPMKPQQPRPADKEIIFNLGNIPETSLPIPAGRAIHYLSKDGKEKTVTPELTSLYKSFDGQNRGVVVRIINHEGRKIPFPLSWDRDLGRFVGKLFPNPPLYNEHLLKEYPDLPVLVVEGEKCAWVAQGLLEKRWVVVTWQGGEGRAGARDFSRLDGRDVTWWPDADPVKEGDTIGIGEKAMQAALGKCKPRTSKWIEPLESWREIKKGFDVVDLLEQNQNRVTAVLDVLRDMSAPVEQGVNRDTTHPRSWLPKDFVGLFMDRSQRVDARAEQNVTLVLEHHPEFKDRVAYDIFERQDMLDGRPLKHAGAARLSIELRRKEELNISSEHLHTLLKALAQDRYVNVFGDQLRTLAKSWDKAPRCLSDYAGVPRTEKGWEQLASRRWMVGLAQRVMNPGHHHHNILVLESAQQGIGKSMFFETLGKVLGRNVTIPLSHITSDTEMAKRMGGKAILELAELNAMYGARAELFKDMISRPEDRFREKYGRDFIDAKRCGVFAATTNEIANYLLDQTGNRRIWPLRVRNDIDIKALARDVDQIWAEAAHRALEGERNHLEGWEVELQEKEVGKRQSEDPMVDFCADAIQMHGSSGRIKSRVLMDHLGISLDKASDPKVRRTIQTAMRKLGWQYQRKTIRVDGEVTWGYQLLPESER